MINLKEKQLKILLILSLIIIGLLIIYILFKPNLVNTLNVEIKESNSCKEAQEYLKIDNYKVYTYCLDNIYIRKNNELTELKEYYLNNSDIFTKLTKKDNNPIVYKDGVSVKYIYDNLAILKCHTLEGNEDIYLGPKDMGYEEGFCSVDKAIVKQYQTYGFFILDIAPSNDEAYIYLTLRAFQGEEVATVRIDKSINPDLKEDTFYKFILLTTEYTKNDTIINLFNTSKIESIEESTDYMLEN